MKVTLSLLALALAGCCLAPAQPASSDVPIEVREVGRSPYCNTPGKDMRVALLPDAPSVVAWQDARGIVLAGSGGLAQAPHAVVEMGRRSTGGYGLTVARSATLRGERVVLQATFIAPAPGSMQTQALTTPCVLVQLPPGRYALVEVHDSAGGKRASGGVWVPSAEPPAPAEPAQ